MGFGNWLLKHGPGSPGSTAKHLTDLYIKLKNSQNLPEEDIWFAIYMHRHRNAIMFKNTTNHFEKNNPEELYVFFKADFVLFCFAILYVETELFRKGISMDIGVLPKVLLVIREAINQKMPNLIKLSIDECESQCRQFIFGYDLPF
jgi:hypothetical protein